MEQILQQFLNFEIMLKVWPLLLRGLGTTAYLCALVIPLGLAGGLMVALLSLSRSRTVVWATIALVDLSTSEVSRHDADGSAAPITRLTTVGIGVLLRRDAPHGLSAAAGAGLLIDIPGDRIGIYRDGSSIAPFGEGLVDYTPPVAALRGLSLELRYDLHGFLTPALRQEGFVNSQIVHRVALALRYPLRRGAGSREPGTGS